MNTKIPPVKLRLGTDDWQRLNEDRYCIFNGQYKDTGALDSDFPEPVWHVQLGSTLLKSLPTFEKATRWLRTEFAIHKARAA